jgi:hypothetical protein
LFNYKVKDILSLYTIQQLKQLKLLEHQLKNTSLILLNQLSLNKEQISISTIEVLTQIFKK